MAIHQLSRLMRMSGRHIYDAVNSVTVAPPLNDLSQRNLSTFPWCRVSKKLSTSTSSLSLAEKVL